MKCGAGDRGTEAGRSGLEYVGIVVLAALVTGFVLYFTPIPITRSFNHAVCTILNFGNCGIADAGTVIHKKSPFERAASGSAYFSGDSFASGEGVFNYEEGTDKSGINRNNPLTWEWSRLGEQKNLCHRSPGSYQAQTYRSMQAKGAFGGKPYQSRACSGSTVSDLYANNGQGNNEGPQAYKVPQSADAKHHFDKIPEDASLIQFSMGGNDIGFGSVVKGCITRNLMGGGCGDTKAIQAKIDTVYGTNQKEGDLELQVKKMKAEHPNARIIIMGYPPLFSELPPVRIKPGLLGFPILVGNGSTMSVNAQKWANARAKDVNQAIAAMAERQGVEFIDPTVAFVGPGYDHRAGSDDPWINGIKFGIDSGEYMVGNESLHPNQKGHDAMAGLMNQKIKEG